MDSFLQLSNWIDPVEVLDVLIRLQSNAAALNERNTLVLRSDLIESGAEAGFSDMVKSYLNSFEVPHSLIILTMAYYDSSDISLQAVSALARLRFDGTVTAYSRTTVPSQMAQDTVLTIEASDLLIDLIKYPCMALLDLVTQSAAFWKQHQEIIEKLTRVEFVPSAPSRLQIAVEKVVASHFGAHTAPEDHGLESPRLNQNYRSLTVSGLPPIPEPFLNEVRRASAAIAKSPPGLP
jgi:hypothetical protein